MKLKHIFLAVFGLLCTYAYSQDMGYFYAGGRVTNVIQENDSIYWVSTFTGLRKINSNNNNITHLNRLNTEMPSNQIYDLAFDNDGRLWLATHEGLAMISDSLSLVYNTSNSSIPADIITTVSVDQQGRIWGGNLLGWIFYTIRWCY